MAAGTITAAANQITANLQLKIGSSLALVQYSGLTPQVVGLYQFNVVVPTVTSTNGQASLSFTLGGTAGTQSLLLAVQ